MKKITVLGSMNLDYTLTVPRFNLPGESLTGELSIYHGGKGANQCVACARLKMNPGMIGCLGNDANGQQYRDAVAQEGADVEGVLLADGVPSGTAFIEVVPSGENRITIARGANDALTAAYVDTREAQIAQTDIFLTQLENPLPAIAEAISLAHRHGCVIILDPAPARPLEDALLAMCDYITPNETELSILTDLPVETEAQAVEAARTLIARGAKAILHKRGAAGAMLITADDAISVPGFKVTAVDTTAAGDSFNAGFASALAMGRDIRDAIVFANAVGALSTTKAGAQPAMPTPEEVESFLKANA